MMFDADGQPNGMISYVVDKTAEKRAQSEFHRYHQLLECISRAQATYISGAGPQQLFEALLRDVLQLTESEYGFISEVVLEGDTPVLNNPFAASVSPSIQSRPLYHESITAGKASENLATLAAPVLRSRAPLICNLQKLGDLKERIPHSHPPLKAFLAMPVLSGSRFVGMLTIANRPGGYDDSVVQHLRSLVATVANLIEAIRQRSERERADQALLESERRLTQFLDALPAGILVIDSGGQSQYANQAAVKLFGSSVDHSKSLLELIQALQLRTSDGGMYPKASLPLVRALNGEQCWADDLEIQGEDKAIPLEVTASPIYASEGEVVYAIAAFSDISERKRVDRMKREFISTVSHELRTPLTSIRGSLGLLVGGAAGVLPTSAQTMLDIAYRNSERLVRLINDILDVEKIESGKLPFNLQEVCLRPLLQQALESNAAYAREFGVEYELDHGGADVQVLVDPDRLLQVLTNLLGNAAKFSPPGAVVKLVTLCSKTSVRVEIRDRGPGIPLSFREKIFQKFSQADASDARQKGGSGLGLSIAKAIVERLGGQVDYVSEVGKGSTFFFELPINGPFPVLPREGGPGTRAHILICEDDPDVASLLRLYLTRAGFGTDVAPNLTLARQLLGEKEYSAMTLDLRLPGESGLSFLRSISRDERLSRLPVIVVSAISEQGRDELNGDAVSFVQWLGKPIEELRLLAAVESATRGNESLPHILHIEDDQGLRQIVAQILKGRAEVATVATLEEARHQVHQTRFDLIILDLHLDDGHGSELVPILNHSPNQGVPVVVFSAFEPTQQLLDQVSAALVKTRTTNEELARTIFRLIRYAGVSDEEGAG